MCPWVVAVAFVLYSLVVFGLKRATYPKNSEPPRPFPVGWEQGHEYTLAISQDFWWAKRFKSRIRQFRPEELRQTSLKNYVKANNKLNLWVSVSLTGSAFIAYAVNSHSLVYHLLVAMAVIRLISRSFEIAYAFGRDVLQEDENTTKLTKFERIKLALISYWEIYIYSAGAYLALPTTKGLMEAVAMSVNVGTLTNVGFAFPDGVNIAWNGLVFIQVFATLSLVVLSLASYLSRES